MTLLDVIVSSGLAAPTVFVACALWCLFARRQDERGLASSAARAEASLEDARRVLHSAADVLGQQAKEERARTEELRRRLDAMQEQIHALVLMQQAREAMAAGPQAPVTGVPGAIFAHTTSGARVEQPTGAEGPQVSVVPRGPATRCTWCHDDVQGAASAQACGGCGAAYHVDCAASCGSRCVAPGCQGQLESGRTVRRPGQLRT